MLGICKWHCVCVVSLSLSAVNVFGEGLKKIEKKLSEIRVFFGSFPINSLARREFENPREFENFPRASPSGNFQIPSDFQIPSGHREFIGKFPLKTRISITNFRYFDKNVRDFDQNVEVVLQNL